MSYRQNGIETDAEVNMVIGTHSPACPALWSLFSNDIILVNLSDYGYKCIKQIIFKK